MPARAGTPGVRFSQPRFARRVSNAKQRQAANRRSAADENCAAKGKKRGAPHSRRVAPLSGAAGALENQKQRAGKKNRAGKLHAPHASRSPQHTFRCRSRPNASSLPLVKTQAGRTTKSLSGVLSFFPRLQPTPRGKKRKESIPAGGSSREVPVWGENHAPHGARGNMETTPNAASSAAKKATSQTRAPTHARSRKKPSGSRTCRTVGVRKSRTAALAPLPKTRFFPPNLKQSEVGGKKSLRASPPHQQKGTP